MPTNDTMATDDSLPVEFVPTATSLATIYPLDLLRTQSERWISLLGKFRTLYGRPAQFVSRSPGRVNLIGEHIDYSLYGVLPMAVAADALLAVAVLDEKESPDGSATIKIANINDAKYPSREITVSAAGDVDIDASVHEWTNYFKSGLRGALNLLKTKGGGKLAWSARSLAVLMDGSVPAGGGLSSSAAFVTASALATLVANADRSITSGDISVDKRELTELAIVSERAVGVNSGG